MSPARRGCTWIRVRTIFHCPLALDETDRTHLDLWAADEHEQLAEVERLLALGASRVEWTYPEGADFVVLADPDGNLFCVINASA